LRLILVACFWLLVSCYWFLVTGCWLLVTGCWLRVLRCKTGWFKIDSNLTISTDFNTLFKINSGEADENMMKERVLRAATKNRNLNAVMRTSCK